MAPLPTLADPTLLDLYAGAADPLRWARALDGLCVETGACSAVAQAFSFDNGRTHVHWSMQDSRTAERNAPPSNGATNSNNPRLDPRRALRGLNRITHDEELFEPGDEARPRLQQQLATLGLGRFIGTLQDVGSGVFLGLALHRAVDDRRDFSAAQIGRLAALAPHVGQAFVLTDHVRGALLLDERLRAHFDRLRCGLAVCDLAGRVRWLNESAGALLGGAGPLRMVASGLQGRTCSDTEILLRELEIAAGDPQGVRCLSFGRGTATLHAAIQAGPQPSTVLLVLTPAETCSDIPPDALVRMFGLTPAEARLAGALVTGSSLEQYARHRGVSVGTVRVQLKQVQAKTGARRQSELVRLVLSSAAAQLRWPQR